MRKHRCGSTFFLKYEHTFPIIEIYEQLFSFVVGVRRVDREVRRPSRRTDLPRSLRQDHTAEDLHSLGLVTWNSNQQKIFRSMKDFPSSMSKAMFNFKKLNIASLLLGILYWLSA